MRKLLFILFFLTAIPAGAFLALYSKAWWRAGEPPPIPLLPIGDIRAPEPLSSYHPDRVVVVKTQRRLYLYDGDMPVLSYPIALGGNPLGHKQQEGDQRTPEGRYVLDYRNPNSRFYRSIHISYPNSADKARARKRGVSPGGEIFIHGLPNGMGWAEGWAHAFDWTDGCIAVSNRHMDELWATVKNGTPIEIRP